MFAHINRQYCTTFKHLFFFNVKKSIDCKVTDTTHISYRICIYNHLFVFLFICLKTTHSYEMSVIVSFLSDCARRRR